MIHEVFVTRFVNAVFYLATHGTVSSSARDLQSTFPSSDTWHEAEPVTGYGLDLLLSTFNIIHLQHGLYGS